MAKTLQDYLGASATITGNDLTISLDELMEFITPGAGATYTYSGNSDEAMAVLIGGIHKHNKPAVDANGIDIVDPDVALVSATSFQERSIVTRNEVSQIQHEFVFNVYTTDTTGFSPSQAV